MLQQTIRGTRALQTLSLRATRSISGASSSNPKSKTPKSPSQEQLDANKKKLEDLEKKSGSVGGGKYERPSREELKKKGTDAQIEQQRPDDGVY
ncbi:LAFA_0C05556g1_1 [Lachancea sp. 'fantastica']|nr:LAFA_0C05556g1_1 [Lachancea sp. 'fantastica']